MLLVIEDLHWADSSTRALPGLPVAQRSAASALLVVATYRSDELHRRHPLRPLLAELARDPRARLRGAAAASRATSWPSSSRTSSARAPDPELVERLYARSEGNPLFTEELLAAGLDGRGALPPTLRDALMLRVERLSRGRAGACCAGSPASRARPRAARRADRPRAARRCATRCARRWRATSWSRSAEGSYAFRHALLREVVYDDLLPGERAELHAALARALEQRCATDERAGAHLTARVGPPLARRRRPAGRVRRLGASRRRRRARERLRRGARPCSSARSRCGTGCPTPRRSPAATSVELLLRAARRGRRGRRRRASGGAAAPARSSWSTTRPSRAARPRVLERLARAQWEPEPPGRGAA